jgi:hypothetical protein
LKRPTRLASLLVLTVVIEAILVVMPPVGLSMLDARLYYRADEAMAFIAELGPRGRSDYFFHECIDLGFIVVYTLLLRALAQRWRLRGRVVRLLVFAPGAADLLETAGILSLLRIYPSGPRLLAGSIGYFTLLKWVGLLAVIITMQIGRLATRESVPADAD